MTNFNNQIRAILQFEPDRAVALEKVMDEILTRFHSQTGTLHLLDAGRGLLVMQAAHGLPPEIEQITREIPIGKGIAGEAARTGQPVTMCNLQTDDSGVARPSARKTGVGGTLCVPLLQGERVVGTLGVGTLREHEYTARETQALLSVGRVLAAVLVAPAAPATPAGTGNGRATA